MNSTIICVTNYEELPFFFEVPGDHQHLDGVVCGTAGEDKEAAANEFALYRLLFKSEGDYRYEKMSFTDVIALVNQRHVWRAITVGWNP